MADPSLFCGLMLHQAGVASAKKSRIYRYLQFLSYTLPIWLCEAFFLLTNS